MSAAAGIDCVCLFESALACVCHPVMVGDGQSLSDFVLSFVSFIFPTCQRERKGGPLHAQDRDPCSVAKSVVGDSALLRVCCSACAQPGLSVRVARIRHHARHAAARPRLRYSRQPGERMKLPITNQCAYQSMPQRIHLLGHVWVACASSDTGTSP